MNNVSIAKLAGSALRRIARGDLGGIVDATRRELRVPASTLGQHLHGVYREARNALGRLAYNGSSAPAANRALYLFYDLEVAPITYDFAWTLVSADLYRRELGLDALRVIIVPGPYHGGRQEAEDYDAVFDNAARQSRLWNIVVDLCSALEGCSVTVCASREEAERIYFVEAKYVFPERYTPNSPVTIENPQALRDDPRLAVLSAAGEAVRYVDRWIVRHCPGRKLVVITLRQSDYMPDRNSDLAAWKAFVTKLDPARYHVALIPDTDKAAEWNETWPNTTVVKEACFNVQLRLAFYERCYYGMGVNSGPLVLALLDHRAAFAMFIKLRDNVPQSARELFNQRGVLVGESPRLCTPVQSWVWDEDTMENIERVFGKAVGLIEKAGRAGA